jgi:Tfp pilus assembly pilus retraction ATPase PilT
MTAQRQDASDVHLVSGHPPIMRVHTVITPMDLPMLTPKSVKEYLAQMIGDEKMKRFEEVKDLDFSHEVQGLGRYRVNAHFQRGTIGLAMRIIKTEVPPLDELNLPEIISRLTYLPSGLKHCLRQDPDIILVGEMRDLETSALAITAAETGHLVLSTLHTVNASQTVERIVDMYPAGQQNQIRSMLANTLQAVISQTLFSRMDQPGMVPAVEVMLCTPAVRNIIREARTFEIPNVIDTNRQLGMISLDNAIAQLYFNNMISREDAIAQAAYPDKLERQLAA